MTARIRLFWLAVKSSYWFYPAAFAIGAFLLSAGTLCLDRTANTAWLAEIGVMELSGPDSASDILVLVSGAMLGVASTVFSITIAAVAYASGTYGPRLLNNFMEDRGNKISLAVFIGTFVFCVNVLRTIRHAGAKTTGFDGQVLELASFVPNLSLLVAYALIVVAVGTLVYFLHHIPSSIRIHTVLEAIGERLIRDIKATYPDTPSAPAPMRDAEGAAITAGDTGYVQSISFDTLATLAQVAGARITLDCRTGDFVHPGMVLARWTQDEDADHHPVDTDKARGCFILGGMRTPDQDLQFLMDELVEIGLRALSPGINDPYTAITAMHWLGAATAELGHRYLDHQTGDDANDGEPRVIRRVVTFAEYVSRGFGSIRSGAATSPLAAMVALETIANAALVIDDETRRGDLMREAAMLFEQAGKALTGPDFDMVEGRYRALQATSA
ncbi:MAG: DUF2254 domain-containing protein [Erythrobacter sp.]